MEKLQSVSFTGKKDKKERNIKGAAKAYGAGILVKVASGLAGMPIMNGLAKNSKSLTKNQVEIVKKGVENALETSELKAKGVEIVNVTKDTYVASRHPNDFIDKMINGMRQVKEGKNAFFHPIENKVIINLDDLPLATFHEMGHALNFHNSKLLKTIQYCRGPLQKIAPLIALLPAITKQEKPKDGKELTAGQKTKNFIRNSSPFVAALMGGIMASEEIVATIKGNNLASKVLDKNLAKKVVGSNRWGLASYTLFALTCGITGIITKKVKDASDNQKEKEAKMLYAHQG